MARFYIQRRGANAQGVPRHEYLRARPTFVPGDDAATPPTEDQVTDLKWTWLDAADQSGWRNGQLPHDFGERNAERWASMIEGASARRIGDAPGPPPEDAAAEERARKREARRAYRKALAAGDTSL